MGGFTSSEADPLTEVEMRKLAEAERTTVRGLFNEMQVLKQKLDNCYEHMDRLIGAYGNLQSQVQQLHQQYVKIIHMKVNGGSTTVDPEDDGS
jgi:septation ring formation regulator EzrA